MKATSIEAHRRRIEKYGPDRPLESPEHHYCPWPERPTHDGDVYCSNYLIPGRDSTFDPQTMNRCPTLLDEFRATINGGPKLWPEHLCDNIAKASVRRWCRQLVEIIDDRWFNSRQDHYLAIEDEQERTREIEDVLLRRFQIDFPGSPIGALAERFPVPIGRRALLREHSEYPYEDLIVFLPAMPFDGDELAIFAACAHIDGVTVDLFGTATWLPQPEGQDWRSYTIGPMRWRIRQDDSNIVQIPRPVTTLIEQASAWWKNLTGAGPVVIRVPAKRGPKRGRYFANQRDFEEFLTPVVRMLLRCAPYTATAVQVSDEIFSHQRFDDIPPGYHGPAADTLKDNCRDLLHITWEQFVEQVRGNLPK